MLLSLKKIERDKCGETADVATKNKEDTDMRFLFLMHFSCRYLDPHYCR